MIPRTLIASLVVFAAALTTAPAAAAVAAAAPQVFVTGTRIHLGDLMPDADAAAAAVDLGPSPAAGVSRLVTRQDIVAALDAKQLPAPATLPNAVRVVRKAKHLAPSDVNAIVREALGSKQLGRGVTLASVRADRPVDVADGWTRVDVDVPRAPKKAGSFATIAVASLFVGDDVIARLPVPLDLAVSAEGATFDTPRGTSVTLIVRRTLVEVRAAGFAAADADIGDPVPIQLRPSGRVVRARLVSKDEAVAMDGTGPTR
jgi:flagellar basal body P-ring formation chaperone FlgA